MSREQTQGMWEEGLQMSGGNQISWKQKGFILCNFKGKIKVTGRKSLPHHKNN